LSKLAISILSFSHPLPSPAHSIPRHIQRHVTEARKEKLFPKIVKLDNI